MKCFALLATLVASACAQYGGNVGYSTISSHPGSYGGNLGLGGGYGGYSNGVAPILANTYNVRQGHQGASRSQYHRQDELKNFDYGYSNEHSSKQERGNAYGGVTGSYSYVDSYGLPQTVSYVADDYGFRATGTNIINQPAAGGIHKRSAQYGGLISGGYGGIVNGGYGGIVSGGYGGISSGYGGISSGYGGGIVSSGYSAPIHASSAVVSTGHAGPTSTQHHRQDELGNYEYGYDNINSAKHESGNAYTGVTGSYTVKDPYSGNRRVDYVADGYGFRLTGASQGGRYRRSGIYAQPLTSYTALDNIGIRGLNSGYGSGLISTGGYGGGIVSNGGYGAGVISSGGYGGNNYNTYNQGATSTGILTTIQNNPGYATSYRVDQNYGH